MRKGIPLVAWPSDTDYEVVWRQIRVRDPTSKFLG